MSRRQWGARKARSSRPLAATRGVKIHYTGARENPQMAGHHDLCVLRVQQIQDGHMDGRDWQDIGYTALVCAHGRVFVGRGPHVLPAANGPGLNSGHYAICLLVGNAGLTQPTGEMLEATRDAIDWLRDAGNAGREIKRHKDGYATDCPGPVLSKWVAEGAPRPGRDHEGDEVPDYVSVGATKVGALPKREWKTIDWDVEYADKRAQHPEDSAVLLSGPCRFALTANLRLDGLPAGQVAKVRVLEAGKDSKPGPVAEFIGTAGETACHYALPADAIDEGRKLKVQVLSDSDAIVTVVGAVAKAFFWR